MRFEILFITLSVAFVGFIARAGESDPVFKGALPRTDAVFVGKITNAGEPFEAGGPQGHMHETWGGIKVKVTQILRGAPAAEVSLMVTRIEGEKNENDTPWTVGSSHIFFANGSKNSVHLRGAIAFTDENLAGVKSWLPDKGAPATDTQPKLPGSDLALEDVLPEAEVVLVGKLYQEGGPGPGTDKFGYGGPVYWYTMITDFDLLRGAPTYDHALVSVYVNKSNGEVPYTEGSRYIFFLNRKLDNPGLNSSEFGILKLLPATDENVRLVKAQVAAVPAPPTTAELPAMTGSVFKNEDAFAKADAVLVGKVTQLGFADFRELEVFLYRGVHVESSQILSGSIAPKISVALRLYHLKAANEEPPSVGNSYILFVKKAEVSAKDPYIVLKVLPSTDTNLASVKKMIATSPGK